MLIVGVSVVWIGFMWLSVVLEGVNVLLSDVGLYCSLFWFYLGLYCNVLLLLWILCIILVKCVRA